MGTGLLRNAPEPSSMFYTIIGKIPGMFDRVYTAVSDPIVRGMILILVLALFLFKLK